MNNKIIKSLKDNSSIDVIMVYNPTVVILNNTIIDGDIMELERQNNYTIYADDEEERIGVHTNDHGKFDIDDCEILFNKRSCSVKFKNGSNTWIFIFDKRTYSNFRSDVEAMDSIIIY